MAQHPLAPDEVVLLLAGRELLEAAAVDVLDPGGVAADEAPGVVAEVLVLLHHVHVVKDGEEETFGDAADACAAVQGVVGLYCAARYLELKRNKKHLKKRWWYIIYYIILYYIIFILLK